MAAKKKSEQTKAKTKTTKPRKLTNKKPDFTKLLKEPLVKKQLPSDFEIAIEVKHLDFLWTNIEEMQDYIFHEFVHAGGSGMVFEVVGPNSDFPVAMKIVREKIYNCIDSSEDKPKSLSPVSSQELNALQKIRHPNVVSLSKALSDEKGVVAICTTYVNPPYQIDEYLQETLKIDSDSKVGLYSFSQQSLDNACELLIHRFQEIASALDHMHTLDGGFYHFDIKPENILVSEDHKAVLTDMGACIHKKGITTTDKVRVHFTWAYAHSSLRDIISEPGSIEGGGVKVSALISSTDDLAKYDLFAFGRTIQRLLAILRGVFGERCHASYGFSYLHIISCLLLDGHNLPSKNLLVDSHDGLDFVTDLALNYPSDIWMNHKISSASELLERLSRFSREYSWNKIAPELDEWQPNKINSVAHSPAPFTKRISAVMNHPCVRRLKSELQLGWIREIFPGAAHDRWSHSLGAFSALVGYYNSLLSDPEVPTFRILINENDIAHAFVAALIHDLGQTTFGHDLEEANPELFQHEGFWEKLINDQRWGATTLSKTIEENWPGLSVKRVLSILTFFSQSIPVVGKKTECNERYAVDGVAADIINGPIDADKLDYLLRDSIACGVPYGHGMDVGRFLLALTVSVTTYGGAGARLSLAYKAKGRPAIMSLLLARYQMYGSVYWHHAFRCIQAMFVHAASVTFDKKEGDKYKLSSVELTTEDLKELFYERVICRSSWQMCKEMLSKRGIETETIFLKTAPSSVVAEPALDFVWQCADDGHRQLIENLANRKLYKRIFEMRLGELGNRIDYTRTKEELSGIKRIEKAKNLEHLLLESVNSKMLSYDLALTKIEQKARSTFKQIKKGDTPLIVIDFPIRGIPSEYNTPQEIEDEIRKYFVLPSQQEMHHDNVFQDIRIHQQEMATVRVFADPIFHELVVRYLEPSIIQKCVEDVIGSLRRIR